MADDAADKQEILEEARAESSSFPLLGLEMGVEPEDSADGLELDDRQSEEMRHIFGVTLPQYLQPVQEMVEQLVAGRMEGGSIPALLGTLSSLSSAASRMGFAEVVEQLDALSGAIAPLATHPVESIPREVRETIVSQLLDLKDLAESMGGAEQPAAQTLFKALAEHTGFDSVVLSRLSAAGLVTVDQVREAEPAEIAAVTGLERAVVDQLIKALFGEPAVEQLPQGSSERIAELPLDEQALHNVLLHKLSAQVDIEAAVQELRAEIRELRIRLQQQRSELEALAQRRGELQGAVQQTAAATRSKVAELSRARASREEVASRYALSSEKLEQEEGRVKELQQLRKSLARHEARLDEELEPLVANLERLLRRVAHVPAVAREKRMGKS